MAKRIIITTALAALTAFTSLAGDVKIPKNAAEDTGNIMSQKYWDVWNPELQKRIDADIEANRKADAVVNVGQVKDGTQVVVEQISHDFIFGAHIFNFDQLGDPALDAKYKALYGTLFNSATVSFYWQQLEMQQGRPRFNSEYWDGQKFWAETKSPKTEPHWRRPAPENVIKFCKQMGIRIHGHPLIWDIRFFHIPTWLLDSCLTDPQEREVFMRDIITKLPEFGVRPKPEQYTENYKKLTGKDLSKMFPVLAQNLKKAFEKRIIELAEYYGDTVDSWDVVNEAAEAYSKGGFKDGDKLMKSRFGVIMPADFVFDAFQTAQKHFPKKVKLNINDYIMSKDYRNMIEEMISRGCKIDIVGSQMHIFNPKAILAAADGRPPAGISPSNVYNIMKTIDIGRPIHLSEITITSVDNTERGRMIQAIIARNMYRLWFSIKPMMGITWWNVVDGCGMPGEPSLSGLFTRGMNPKPAFYALDELINREWRTNLSASPDADGNVKFRGFKGKYRLSWFDKDGKEQFKIVNVK